MSHDPNKLLPHDLDAERATLSAMVLCDDDLPAFVKIREILWPDAFFQPDHRIILRAICRQVDAGKPNTVKALAAAMLASGEAQEIGGLAYFAQVMDANFSASSGVFFAEKVAEHARRRETITLADKIKTKMMEEGIDSRRVIGRAIDALCNLDTHGRNTPILTLEEMIAEFMWLKDEKKATNIKCGIGEFDDFLGLFCLSKYTVVGARPSMGKSTFTRWLLGRFANEGMSVGLVAVEEDRNKIAGNYLSEHTSLPNDLIAYGEWTPEISHKVAGAIPKLAGQKWFGTDAAHSLDEITGAIDTLSMKHKCQVIVVDHLHLIKHRGDNREQELSEISGTLKLLAKKRNICLIAAAQLSRPEKVRVPPPPSLTDFRGSGGIEEHADAVLMLHREDYYRRLEPNYNANGLCQFIIPKNRNGRVGEIVMRAELHHQRFSTYDTWDARSQEVPV